MRNNSRLQNDYRTAFREREREREVVLRAKERRPLRGMGRVLLFNLILLFLFDRWGFSHLL